MACLLVFSLICMLSFSPAISQETKAIPLETASQSDTLNQNTFETYIVHVSMPDDVVDPPQLEDLESWYSSFLPKNATGMNDVSRMLYSYRNVITGFAARLSVDELKEMEKKEGFLYATPQKILALHTTRSPKFMGLDLKFGLWNRSKMGEGVIIGVLDGGIKADHPSFRDEGMEIPPTTWKGRCDLKRMACNKKLIGAGNFLKGTPGLPVDVDDHGSHTSSTAAGNFVGNASLFGNANGTAVGMAPRAHLAMYQVCDYGCPDTAILAAMDAAIEDGVNVLSISLGPASSIPLYDDPVAIGAFRAIQKGIFVSCSAGNSGPLNSTVRNAAPWILTVGASTIDRNIRATAVLGNGYEFNGESLFQPKDFPSTLLPLVYPGMNGDQDAAQCVQGSLNKTEIKGKIVLCEYGYSGIEQGQVVKDAGGAAMIHVTDENSGYVMLPEAHVLPATAVNFVYGQAIKAYINSTSKPTATIVFKGTVLGVKTAPLVAYFSARGPSKVNPGIVKPDVIGPGWSVLAAWPSSVDNSTNTTSTFNMISGTSMSCPHLSGVAALIKSTHREWSPAVIKSAIVTTANPLNLHKSGILDHMMRPASIIAIGAGHVNPSQAANPGLVYDNRPDDYIPYLCGLGYKDEQVQVIVNRPVKCSGISSIPEAQLNYPSFAIELGSTNQTYTRTVTNVGNAQSTYDIEIEKIPGVDVQVQPKLLNFAKRKQQRTYQISFGRSDTSINNTYVQGAIIWVSDKHTVRSPISIKLV